MHATYQIKIAALYQQMFGMLFEYARGVLRNESLAEEAVQDTFCIACQKPEALCESTNPEGWLVNTLKFVISNAVRKQNISQRILADYYESNLNELCITNDSIDVVILYGNLVHTEEFKLVKAWAVDGASYEELSQMQGISLTACRKRMQRAKETLRRRICL